MPDDSAKVKTYFDLFWQEYRSDYQSAHTYALAAEALTKKLELPFEYADAIRVKSFALVGMGKYDEAKKALDRSLELFEAMDDRKMISDVMIELGSLFQTRSNLEKALQYYLDALTITREVGEQNYEARALNYIGSIYKQQKQYDKSISNFKKALALVEISDFKPGISACLTNIATVYTLTGNYDEALTYHQKALQLKLELGDKLGQGRVLKNIADLQNLLKDYGQASINFERTLELAQEIGDKKLYAQATYGKMETAFAQSRYGDCIALGERLLEQTDSLKNLELEGNLHKLLFKSYGKQGDYGRAFEKAAKWQVLSDSLYNETILSVTNELEAKYQNEQKSKEIELLASEREVQELQLANREKERNAIIVFALLFLILGVMLYNQYRIKQRANKELRELDELKSNFFANISHEFRTPLTLIKGPIEHLEQNPEDRLAQHDVKMIRRNTNKVLGLVNQLLELSKIDQGKLELKPTEGDLFQCLRAAVFSFNSHAAQRHMDYRVEIPNMPFWASFDRDKLEKIVYNLLSNAFKFSDDGTLVSFLAEYGDGYLNLQVSDSGKGISEDKLPFIFDRFYQVDGGSTRERGGSGIGLSLSKDLVALMDGTITVSSEEGKGTFFTVQLPIIKIETREKAVVSNNEMKGKREAQHTFKFAKPDSRKLPQILLVEDNADMRQFIKANLLGSYRITEAHNGIEGLEKARIGGPDLIITDLMMPKMDGIELCQTLKNDLQTSHLPIIMLTAKAGMENKIEGLESGADEYLTKPFDASELQARVKNLIAQRERLKQHFSDFENKVEPGKVATSSLDEKFLVKLLEVLEKEHSNPQFGVSQMQDLMAMSKTQLHRKLKALTDESPGELLRNFRLKRAAQLLSSKTDSVTQVAYQVGFNNLSYFAKCFKTLYGVSPSSY
ncbi:MAG: tetratricopeptide repeat protein [Bacteroidota bacterium]